MKTYLSYCSFICNISKGLKLNSLIIYIYTWTFLLVSNQHLLPVPICKGPKRNAKFLGCVFRDSDLMNKIQRESFRPNNAKNS